MLTLKDIYQTLKNNTKSYSMYPKTIISCYDNFENIVIQQNSANTEEIAEVSEQLNSQAISMFSNITDLNGNHSTEK